MNTIIGTDAAKLAGLLIDLSQKIRSGQVTLDQLEWFNKLTRKEREQLSVSRIITVDRARPFNPVELLGPGWTIDEQDKWALSLNRIDLANVRLEHMLKENETGITGEERLKRVKKAGHIRLDAKVFQKLWENQKLIPESWKEKTDGYTNFIFFDGTILRNPLGDRCALYFHWDDSRWSSGHVWLEEDRYVDYPSAVITSI